MRHQEINESWQPVIRRAVRSANRRATYILADGPKQGDNLIMLNLSVGHLQTSIPVSSEELEHAVNSTLGYEKLRHRVRRALARALHAERSHFIFTSKTVRPGSESVNFFRPGGRRP